MSLFQQCSRSLSWWTALFCVSIILSVSSPSTWWVLGSSISSTDKTAPSPVLTNYWSLFGNNEPQTGAAPATIGQVTTPSAATQMQAGQQPLGTAPVGSQPVPVNSQPASVNSQPAPVNSQPAPVNSQPAPVGSQPAPVNSQPAPVNSQPAPVNSQPVAGNPQPVGAQQQQAPAATSPYSPGNYTVILTYDSCKELACASNKPPAPPAAGGTAPAPAGATTPAGAPTGATTPAGAPVGATTPAGAPATAGAPPPAGAVGAVTQPAPPTVLSSTGSMKAAIETPPVYSISPVPAVLPASPLQVQMDAHRFIKPYQQSTSANNRATSLMEVNSSSKKTATISTKAEKLSENRNGDGSGDYAIPSVATFMQALPVPLLPDSADSAVTSHLQTGDLEVLFLVEEDTCKALTIAPIVIGAGNVRADIVVKGVANDQKDSAVPISTETNVTSVSSPAPVA